MDETLVLPMFATPRKFSSITGLSVKEIRILCRLQIIPCEKTKHNYRITVEPALEILKKRAAGFEGHKYEVVSVRKIQPRPKPKRCKNQPSFEEMLDALKADSGAFAEGGELRDADTDRELRIATAG